MYNKLIMGIAAMMLFAAMPAMADNSESSNEAASAELDFSKLDTDQDGKITESEFLSGTGLDLQTFKLIDTNKDSKLGEREVANYNATLKGVHGK